jgi:hypothetical protein
MSGSGIDAAYAIDDMEDTRDTRDTKATKDTKETKDTDTDAGVVSTQGDRSRTLGESLAGLAERVARTWSR